MKKHKLILLLTAMLILPYTCPVIQGQDQGKQTTDTSNKDRRYIDGRYTGISRSKYTNEPYWGIVNFIVENGIISSVSFTIRDSALHETFDAAYEKHFEGNPLYIQQSRNDWAGVKAYPRKFSKKQDISKLDAISGATWSYNIFRAALGNAFKNGPMDADTLSPASGSK